MAEPLPPSERDSGELLPLGQTSERLRSIAAQGATTSSGPARVTGRGSA
jgi:hypothetical protein